MPATTSAFLNALYPKGLPDQTLLELRIDTGESLARLWCPTLAEVIPAALPYVAGPKPAQHVWFGPGLRSRQQGRDIDVAYLPALWVDCDAKCFPNNTKEEAAAHLAAFAVPPSIIVDTGHGVQGYWLFEEYETDMAAAVGAMRWLNQEISRGLPVQLDHVHNPSRILRLPNTINHKSLPSMPCRVIALEPALRFTTAALGYVEGPAGGLALAYSDDAFVGPMAQPRELLERAHLKGMAGWVQMALFKPDQYYNGDASGLDWKVISELVQYLSLHEVESLWLGTPLGQRVKVQLRQDYRRATIFKAQQEQQRKKEAANVAQQQQQP